MPGKRRMDAHIYFGSFTSFRDIETVRAPVLEGKPVIATHLYLREDQTSLCGVTLAAVQQASFTTVQCQLCWLHARRLQEGPRKPLLAPRWKPYAYGDRWSYRFV